MALSATEIQNLKLGGQKLVGILNILVAAAKPGVNLLALEQLAEAEAIKAGGTPSFKGFDGYPASSCLCVNDGIVHCIPIDYTLQEGDILTIDMGLYYQGLHTDSAITLPIGEISPDKQRLLRGTYQALRAGVAAIGPDVPVPDVSAAIEASLNTSRLTIFKEFVGHGVGKSLHQPPYIPNYVERGFGRPKLGVGTAVAIEPIVGLGSPRVDFLPDGWSTRTQDGQPAAVFEETVLITPEGAEIITPIAQIVESLKIS